MNKKTKTTLSLNKNDIIPFIDGLDISVVLSMVTYLSSYFLSNMENRNSLIVMTSLILLSFLSRVFDLKFLKLFKDSFLSKINIFYLITFAYLLQIIIFDSFPLFLSVIIYGLGRFLFGIFISLGYRGIVVNGEELSCQLFEVKNWIIYGLGLASGFLIFLFINEIYSNDFLNNGGWKILYIIIISIILIKYLFFIIFLKNKFFFKYDHDYLNDQKPSPYHFSDFIIVIPLISFLVFTSSNWLPKFSNPENLHFLNYDFLYLFLTILTLVFISPLANLVGKKKSLIFFNLSLIFIPTICSFIRHDSTYSIDFLKLFISISSSFSICCFIFHSQIRKNKSFEMITSFNYSLSLLALILPIFFYYSIYFSINYSGIYIFFAIVYFINYITFTFKKYG